MTPKSMLVDMSPVLYSNLISVTNQLAKGGLKKDPDTGKYPFNYKSEVIFAIFEEIKTFRGFGAQDIILAFDNSTNGYWRKQHYDRYKYKRSKAREESDIDWNSAFDVFDELKNILREFTSFRVVDVESMEADDIAFTLAEYLQDKGGVILHSLDHDWQHALNYDNVKLFKTRKTQKKAGIFIEMAPEELKELEAEHCIAGDPGDGFCHIKSWSQFSPEFLAEYPKFEGKELELYDKHHLIEHKYNLKYDFDPKRQAYKHPRFGYKSFKKTKKPLEELLNENPIYKKNYHLNKKLCLPTSIPQEYKDKIIEAYNSAEIEKNPGELTKFFTKNNLFELTGIVGLL